MEEKKKAYSKTATHFGGASKKARILEDSSSGEDDNGKGQTGIALDKIVFDSDDDAPMNFGKEA